jgi:CRP-like cAMP-binding protein
MSAEHVTLLRGLGQEHLKALLQAGTVLRCRAGDTMLREGEAGHEMFLILDGVARFSQSKENGRESQIGIAGKGEIFGEIALMAKAKRNATVEALSDMQVLVISQDFLNRAMKSLPDIAMRLLYNLSHVLAQKLQVTTQRWQETLRETERLALLAVDRGKGATLSGEAFSKASAGTPDLARTSILRRK